MNKRMIQINFSAMQILYWCFSGSFSGFALALFTDKGFSAAAAGTVLGCFTLGAFGGQIFFSRLCDYLGDKHRVFMVNGVLSLVMCFAVFFLPKQTGVMMLVYGMLGFLQSPMATIMDTWILQTYHDTPQAYGPIRAWGSLGYAIFMLFFGGMVQKYGYGMMLCAAAVLMIALLALAMHLPDQRFEKPQNRQNTQPSLWRSRNFLFVVLVAFCIGMASAPLMQFTSLYLQNVHGTLTHQGIALCVSAMLQVPFMMLSARMTKISVAARMLLVSLLYMLGAGIIAWATTPIMIIVANAVTGIAFGICLPTLREAVFYAAPPDGHTTAQGICDAFFNSVAGTCSSILAGAVIESKGVFAFMTVCIALQLAVATLLLLQIFHRKETI